MTFADGESKCWKTILDLLHNIKDIGCQTTDIDITEFEIRKGFSVYGIRRSDLSGYLTNVWQVKFKILELNRYTYISEKESACFVQILVKVMTLF